MSVMPQTFIWFIGNTPLSALLPWPSGGAVRQEASISPPRLRRTVAGDAVGFQPFLKGPDPAGGLVGALHHVVQGNQGFHVARHPPELPGDQVRLPVVVVDPSIMAYSKEMRRPVLSK